MRLSRRAIAISLSLSGAIAVAQEAPRRESLSMTDPCRAVTLDPGGEVVLRGAVRSSHDGTVFDAMTSRPGAIGVGSEGQAVPGGLYDLEAGGWTLVSRDPAAHAYRLAAAGRPGVACEEARVASPCLPLRLLPLAQSRLLAAADFARTLSGEVTIEVLDPDARPGPITPFFQRYGVAMLAGACALAVALGLARQARSRATNPLALLQRKASRLRSRLAVADPVYRELVPSLDALVRHAEELHGLRDRLFVRIEGADVPSLERRRAMHAAAETGGTPEAAGARALVEEQIERTVRWDREARRAAARIAEIDEYLNALSQRLDESLRPSTSERESSTREALAALELDVQSALEGAREADRIS